MSYDAEANGVHLDNYWTNELTPEAVECTPEGELIVDLPQGCEYPEDGSFSIPEYQADFLENPDAPFSRNFVLDTSISSNIFSAFLPPK